MTQRTTDRASFDVQPCSCNVSAISGRHASCRFSVGPIESGIGQKLIDMRPIDRSFIVACGSPAVPRDVQTIVHNDLRVKGTEPPG